VVRLFGFKEEKENYDHEKLTNPYTDTRLLFGDLKKEIKRVLVGIDIDVADLLLAKELSKTKLIDLVISHHPQGKALAALNEVMELQIEVLAKYGIPINIAEKLTNERMSEVGRNLSPGNFQRIVQAAEILNIPLICVHTAADNCVASFLDKLIKKNKNKQHKLQVAVHYFGPDNIFIGYCIQKDK